MLGVPQFDFGIIFYSQSFQSSLLSGLILALVGLAFRIFNPKEKIIWGIAHTFIFRMPVPEGQAPPPAPLFVSTRSVYIRNQGTAPAEGLELHLNYKPTHLQLWPIFPYTETFVPGGHVVLTIPSLGIKEFVAFELIAVAQEMPLILRVRTKTREWAPLSVSPVRVLSPRAQAAMIALMAVGAFFALKTTIDLLVTLLRLKLFIDHGFHT